MRVGALGAATFLVILLQVVLGVPTVKTLAGHGNSHYRDGVGTEAAFRGPSGVAVFADGRIAVADTGNHCIRLVTVQGAVTTLAGTDTTWSSDENSFADGTGAAARFGFLTRVAVLPNGNIVVSEMYNNRIRIVTLDGVVTTLAGGGVGGFADGTATSARFNYPMGVAALPNGNIVVADTYNHRIRIVTLDGVVTTLAGSGAGGFADGATTSAIFRSPRSVAVLPNNDVVVADTGNNCIRLVSNGYVSTLAGTCNVDNYGFADGAGQTAKFSFLQDVAVLPNGDIAVADNNRVRVVTSGGIVTTLAGDGSYGFADGAGTAARFNQPSGVAVLPSGSIVVADTSNHRIRLVAPSGAVMTLAGCEGIDFADGAGIAARFRNPTGVAAFPNGNFVVADSLNHRIRLVTPTGAASTLAGNGTYGWADGSLMASQFKQPQGLSLFPDGNIVVADTYNHRIRIMTLGGVTTLAGKDMGFADGTGTSAKFNYPSGVAVLPNGAIVVADTCNHRIRIVTLGGVVTTLAGSDSGGFADGTGTSAKFNYPMGVAVLPNGNIVAADTQNNRIRIVTLEGVVTTLAGGSNFGFADGTSTSARFNYPIGVAALPDGNIVVVDTDNTRIRIVTPAGVVTTLAGGDGICFADEATCAAFTSPAGIAVLPNGNVVVTDTYYHLLRVIEFDPPTGGGLTLPPLTFATTVTATSTAAPTTPTTAQLPTQAASPTGESDTSVSAMTRATTTATTMVIASPTTAQLLTQPASPTGESDTSVPAMTRTTATATTMVTASPAALTTAQLLTQPASAAGESDTSVPAMTRATTTAATTQAAAQASTTQQASTWTTAPLVTTTQPACAELTFYNEMTYRDCSPAVSCTAELCTCLGVTSRVASCLSNSTANCSQRTRCIGKSVRCLNENALRFLSVENCSLWASSNRPRRASYAGNKPIPLVSDVDTVRKRNVFVRRAFP